MSTPRGKHARQVEATPSRYGKHAGAIRVSRNYRQIALSIALVAAIIIVPFSFSKMLAAFDKIAPDSAASARSFTSDVSADALSTSTATASRSDTSDAALAAVDAASATTVGFNERVEARFQNQIMPGGCEFISLDIVLASMGIQADIKQIVADHLTIDGHFATGYAGDPYSAGGGFAKGVVDTANSYLFDVGSTFHAVDLTGKPFDVLKAYVDKGYPLLVWSTMGFQDPQFTGDLDAGQEWYANEHCVVLYGFEGADALVSDPLEGLVKRDAERFADLYRKCGSMAVVIL